MTNLFLNATGYIAMDDRPQINSADRTEIFGVVKPVFFQYFEQTVDDCCMRIDLEFGLQLGKNREKTSQDQYIKLLEYLRSVRKAIKQNYLSGVNDAFDDGYQEAVNNRSGQLDFSKISLIGDDAVKENHAITQIIRQCEHLFYEELASLNKHLVLQQGKKTVADSQNPIFPEQLVRTLVEVVKPLKLNTDSRIALYKTFEVSVFSQLGFIYRELIRLCEAAVTARVQTAAQHNGVSGTTRLLHLVSETVKPVSASAEQPNAEFKLLQKKLELWRWVHFPSAYDLISVAGNAFYERLEIKNALHALQQLSGDADLSEKKQPLKWRVLKKLEELSFSVDAKTLAKHDEDALDLAALIFNEIARDESFPDTAKTVVLQLEIPLAAASLGRYSVFTNQDNPVRQLLDDLFAAGMFLNADEEDDRLVQERIASAVKKMTGDSGFEFSGWEAEAGKFSNYLNGQKQRSRNMEESARQFMMNKPALDSNRKIVSIIIENSMKGKTLPTAITGFLRDTWADVLLDAYTHKDDQPEQWGRSVQAMDELIVSIMPPADDNARKRILKLLPGLIAELRKGLKQIACDKSAQSRFFKDLAVRHIILMDKKERTTGDFVKNDAAHGDRKITAEATADDSAELAGNLAVGSWVAFTSESVKQWGKLIWKDAATESMLFVGKSGVKLFEIQANRLAEKLRLGQVAIVKINEKTLTERVLSELMSL
ncbi:MAG: DUF1631 domain-containing protein [Methylobacter sp.]|jgi:hypothetical protein|nr:DUF1631 domain-containing protein [Methylobacter sp.]